MKPIGKLLLGGLALGGVAVAAVAATDDEGPTPPGGVLGPDDWGYSLNNRMVDFGFSQGVSWRIYLQPSDATETEPPPQPSFIVAWKAASGPGESGPYPNIQEANAAVTDTIERQAG